MDQCGDNLANVLSRHYDIPVDYRMQNLILL